MGSKKYPPLKYKEVVAILKALGFKFDRSKGDHEQYEGYIKNKRRLVTVDVKGSPYNEFIIKCMIKQSGVTYKKFYKATSKTAKKIRSIKK